MQVCGAIFKPYDWTRTVRVELMHACRIEVSAFPHHFTIHLKLFALNTLAEISCEMLEYLIH